MSVRVDLVYCAARSTRFAAIAVAAGYRYGACLPAKTYYPVWFADQDWQRPDRTRYVDALRHHRPRVATVLDWERAEQLDDVIAWAEDVAPYVETIVVIPKVAGVVSRLPRRVGGRSIRLGYSVPTRFGGTCVPLWEFGGWPVHLLGGQPRAQLELARYLDVRSADGNYAQLKARWACYWDPRAPREWPQLGTTDRDAPYLAFERSCRNIQDAWGRIGC